MNPAPRISIVIVSYKSRRFIDRCLAPFVDRPDVEIILWENASGDGIGEYIRTKYPGVRLFDSPENIGFARANNRAFEHCRGRYILALNPDAFVEHAETVDVLADYLDANPDVAACGPRLVHEDGSHQVGDAGWRINVGTVFVHSFMLQRIASALHGLYLINPRLLDRREIAVDWVCGACTMVRRDIIDTIGGFDEEVFMYGEDIEWGTRMRDAGKRVSYLPRISVLHLQGATQRSGAQLFSSTKWLDDIARRYGRIGSRPGYVLLGMSVFIGYGLRAAIFYALGRVMRRSVWIEKANIMQRYACHVFDLPSFNEARGSR